MENSPLRFLDYDMSRMLADQVRISQEEEARMFHGNLQENSHEINLNWGNLNLLVLVFKDIGYLLTPAAPRGAPYKPIEQHMYATERAGFKRNYDRVAKYYIETTRRQWVLKFID